MTGKSELNVEAIVMFMIFVLATLGITKWAAGRTKSAADFYAAGLTESVVILLYELHSGVDLLD